MSLTAEANRVEVFAVLEGTNGVNYGITPVGAVWEKVRNTGTTLGLSKNPLQSKELKSNRMPADMRHGTRIAQGDINAEFSYAWIDPYLEAVLGGTWTASGAGTVSGSFTAVAATNSFSSGMATFDDFIVGDLVLISGFANAANNGVFRIGAGTDTSNLFVVGRQLVNEGPIPASIVGTEKLTAGTIRRSFSVLRHFSDLDSSAKPYHTVKGCEFNSLAVSIKPEEIVTAKFAVTGQDQVTSETVPGGTFSPVDTHIPMDSFAGSVIEGGTAIAIATSIEFTINNNIAPRYVIGSDRSLQPSIGDSGLTGTLTAYFDSSDLIDKFIDEIESGLIVSINDPAGNTYVFEFPRIKYTAGQPDVATGPIILTMPWTAQEELTGTNTHVCIWRAAAPEA